MNDWLNKAGLYEAVGVLSVGVTVLMVGLYLELPIIRLQTVDNDFIQICFFFVVSYFIGIIFLETGRFIDRAFKIQKNIWLTFLSDSKAFVNAPELKEYRNLANQILQKPTENEIFSKADNMYVFYYCKGLLEVNGKDAKVEKHESLGDMSRSLMVAFPCLTIYYIFESYPNAELHNILFLLLLTLLCYIRVKKYAYYRIRVLMRHYRALTKENR